MKAHDLQVPDFWVPHMGLELLTVTEAAAEVRVTPRTLENYWRKNAGPARTKVGGRVFITRDNLAAWLRAGTDA
jgi:Helix-turn-helix domain